MRRSVLVKVPSFSRLGRREGPHPRSGRSSLKKMSCTTKNSSLRKRRADVVAHSNRRDHVFAKHVHRLQLALVDRLDHLVIVQTLGRRQLDAPVRFERARTSGSSTF